MYKDFIMLIQSILFIRQQFFTKRQTCAYTLLWWRSMWLMD